MKLRACLTMAFLLLISATVVSEELLFSEFYDEGVLGLDFSGKTKSLAGKSVSVTGFMAPPLKVQGNFFVLTRQPVSLCPFCNSDADWPADIVVVYLKKSETFRQRNRSIVVTGRLSVGSYTDPSTGFVSLLRLEDSIYKDE